MAKLALLVGILGLLATLAQLAVDGAPVPESVPDSTPVGTAARLEAVLVSAHRYGSADRCRDDGTLEADADERSTDEDPAAAGPRLGGRSAPVWYTAKRTVIVPGDGHGVLQLCGLVLEPPPIAAACVAPWGMSGSQAVRWVNRPQGAAAVSAVTDLVWTRVAGAVQAALGGLDGSLLLAVIQPEESSSDCMALQPQPSLEADAPTGFVGAAEFIEWLPALYGSACTAKSSPGGC